MYPKRMAWDEELNSPSRASSETSQAVVLVVPPIRGKPFRIFTSETNIAATLYSNTLSAEGGYKVLLPAGSILYPAMTSNFPEVQKVNAQTCSDGDR
jgi:hypothetical protein